jgi:hypothetical protein
MSFVDLEHPELEPFEPTLRRLIETAFDPPVLVPKSAKLAARWSPYDRSGRLISETVRAYRDVQRGVAAEVVSLEKQARELAVNLKIARKTRDAATTTLQHKIQIVRRRQLILRRILDAIVYMACGQYVWYVRRLALRDDVQPIEPQGLAHIVEIAERLNEQDSRSVYLAADLTTSVQIGDLVQISMGSRLRWRIRILEVKEGEINRIITKRLATGESPETLREKLGDKAAEQAERMLRQRRRLDGLTKLVRERRGVDPRTNQPLRRTTDRPPTPGYQPELRMLVEKAARTGQHLIAVDECLVLAALRADAASESRLAVATHALFHRDHADRPCLLPTSRAQEELDLLLKEPPVIDLVEHTYRSAWGSPVFTWGTLDRVCDLLTGRISVYAKFDAAVFMKRAARMGIRMKWVTGRRAEMLKQTGGTAYIPGSPRASAILVELPDGTRFELFSGGLARIFLELAKPDALLRGMIDLAPDVREAQEAVMTSSVHTD